MCSLFGVNTGALLNHVITAGTTSKKLAELIIIVISSPLFKATVMFALALAIEFGQRYTKQGIMDFDDVLYGIYGFIAFFIIYQVGLKIVQLIRPSNKKGDKK